MPRVDNPASPLVAKLDGLHLFHFDGAPCAQRVRFALAEKGLKRGREVAFDSDRTADCQAREGTWTSRTVSLVKKQHLSPAYAQIQPNLVVPALVHDGVLYTESMDIVEYIDHTFGGPPLVPRADAELLAEVERLTSRGKELHRSIRFVTFRWGLGSLGRLDAKEEENLRKLLQERPDEERLIDFYESWDNGTIAESVYEAHLDRLIEGFSELEELLSDGRAFLTGSALTMADIIWAMKMPRLQECGFPFRQRFPALHAWYVRISARPAFIDGVMGRHRTMNRVFRVKAGIEHLIGVGLKRKVLGRARAA